MKTRLALTLVLAVATTVMTAQPTLNTPAANSPAAGGTGGSVAAQPASPTPQLLVDQPGALNGRRGGTGQRGGGGAPRRGGPPVRLPVPAFIPAGPDAEALVKALAPHRVSPRAVPGANPPLNAEGDFIIGPDYVPAPEMTAVDGVPKGNVIRFTMNSAESKIYPGISKAANGTLDPENIYTLIVDSHPTSYTRTITVYVPAGYVPGTPAPLMVGFDGTGYLPTTMLDNMIAQKRIPPLVAVGITPGNFPQGTNNDAQGSQRGLEYDTMSGKLAEFVETEVLPLVEKNANVVITKDPEGRGAIGGSSGASAAFSMAWYRPDLYHRIISYSGTFVNQQWPFNPETPHGAWGYHENIIANSEVKPLRIWMQVSDADLLNPNVMKDNMHDWVEANNRMAAILRTKGYHYQYAFSLNSGHTTAPARNQTYAHAYEWVWQGYKPTGK